MSDDRAKVADYTKQGESCDVIVELQPDRSCEEIIAPVITDKENAEEFSEPEHESEDNPTDGKRHSQCSQGTENSILSSPHASLQALQALNDASAQNNDEIHDPEEICLCEQGPLNDAKTTTNNDVFLEFDLSCNSPLLNGHAMDNDANITTEKPQETNAQRKNNTSRKARGVLSRLSWRPGSRTSPVNPNRTNGDVVITIDSEDTTFLNPRQAKPKPSLNVRLKGWLEPMDNKMNMKVFGSRKAMTEELLRFKKAGWIIHPTSAFRYEILLFHIKEKKLRYPLPDCVYFSIFFIVAILRFFGFLSFRGGFSECVNQAGTISWLKDFCCFPKLNYVSPNTHHSRF